MAGIVAASFLDPQGNARVPQSVPAAVGAACDTLYRVAARTAPRRLFLSVEAKMT